MFIGCGLPAMAADFAATQPHPIEVVVDPSRKLYDQVGMERGVGKTLSPRGLGTALDALRSGHIQGRTRGDPWQLGGVLIIEADGALRWSYISRHAGDHPDLDTILAAAP